MKKGTIAQAGIINYRRLSSEATFKAAGDFTIACGTAANFGNGQGQFELKVYTRDPDATLIPLLNNDD